MHLELRNFPILKVNLLTGISFFFITFLIIFTFIKSKINLSQILLTLEDTEKRRRAINAKRTFENLFSLSFIPIVNENDSIATSEIKYGDNDRLASRVAQISSCLLYTSPSPRDRTRSRMPSSA